MKTNTFLVISLSFLPRMRNYSDKFCREDRHIHFIINNVYF